MKKLVILFLIFHLSFLISPQTVSADDIELDPTPVSYEMTHPGLLPDHPLYFLKVARDTMTGFFKGKPEEKAAFALQQADKHMVASHMLLVQKDNPELAYTSLQHAQNYLEEAITQTNAAKKEGWDTQEMCQKVKNASKKHVVILTELGKHISPEDKQQFTEEKKRADSLLHMATALHHK
jgi:hypothetical protein